jgi:hypothetical protein
MNRTTASAAMLVCLVFSIGCSQANDARLHMDNDYIAKECVYRALPVEIGFIVEGNPVTLSGREFDQAYISDLRELVDPFVLRHIGNAAIFALDETAVSDISIVDEATLQRIESHFVEFIANSLDSDPVFSDCDHSEDIGGIAWAAISTYFSRTVVVDDRSTLPELFREPVQRPGQGVVSLVILTLALESAGVHVDEQQLIRVYEQRRSDLMPAREDRGTY